jgi:hypothetical protein
MPFPDQGKPGARAANRPLGGAPFVRFALRSGHSSTGSPGLLWAKLGSQAAGQLPPVFPQHRTSAQPLVGFVVFLTCAIAIFAEGRGAQLPALVREWSQFGCIVGAVLFVLGVGARIYALIGSAWNRHRERSTNA